MKIAIIDPVGGISGDMLLGCLAHCGCPKEYLDDIFSRLSIGPFTFEIKPNSINSISCVQVQFDIPATDHGRTYAFIRDNILTQLPQAIRRMAEKIFAVLAEAESEIHGCPIEHVHFHEVGAVDSILDIVGISAAFTFFGIDAIYTLPVPLGNGMVDSLHGRIPVPAPATLKLLEGIKVKPSTIDAELTTPTGAAVLRALAEKKEPPSEMIIKSIGYGCGTKRFENWPNLCRVMLCEVDASSSVQMDKIYELQANIDDMLPEDSSAALDKILETGAKDAFISPSIMKKGRPGFILTALCPENRLNDVLLSFFTHTSTIGVRYHLVERQTLHRRQYRLATALGEINIKEVTLPDGTLRFKPEYRDILDISRRTGLPHSSIRDEVKQVVQKKESHNWETK